MRTTRTVTAILGLLTCSALATGEPDRLEDGKKAYEAYCARCHEGAVASAPMTGNREDWKGRSHLWEAVLFEHAEKGYFDMPARGGSESASEYEVETAAEYMLTITHPDQPRD